MSQLDVPAAGDLDPAAAVVWHAVEFARPQVLALIRGLSPEQLAARPAGFSNSLSSLMLHCAGACVNFAAWITGEPVPADLKAEFHLDKPHTPLYQPPDETAAGLEAKWDKANGILRSALASVRGDSLDRVITLRGHELTLRWLLAQITFHTPDHYGQMVMVKQHLG
ncbi:MAG: DUF664 domain-containing protein [bacterium]|nr:DUF664 domain-containing protein [bacterium]